MFPRLGCRVPRSGPNERRLRVERGPKRTRRVIVARADGHCHPSPKSGISIGRRVGGETKLFAEKLMQAQATIREPLEKLAFGIEVFLGRVRLGDAPRGPVRTGLAPDLVQVRVDLRPEQEALDPDYDPWAGFKPPPGQTRGRAPRGE